MVTRNPRVLSVVRDARAHLPPLVRIVIARAIAIVVAAMEAGLTTRAITVAQAILPLVESTRVIGCCEATFDIIATL